MKVLDRDSDEYKLIVSYVENTHAPSHEIQIEIIDILKLNRSAEREQFRADINNRQLLWHGSRISNMAGILSQGLRIAPPEAPVVYISL